MRLEIARLMLRTNSFGYCGFPARIQLGSKLSQQFAAFRATCNVFILGWSGLIVVNLLSDNFMRVAFAPLDIAVAVGTQGIAHQRLAFEGARILAEGGGFPRQGWIVEEPLRAYTLQMLGLAQIGQIAQCWIDVNELDKRGGAVASCFCTWNRNQQGSVGVVFHIAVLAPTGVLAEFPAVIAPENDDRVIAQA